MPVLRLFAAAREAAGTATVQVPGATVDDVLVAARARFGPDFGAVLDASKVWRNGEPAHGADLVSDRDEVAVLPPVSGGSGDGGPRRPRFAPAEPPPSDDKPKAPRRSPGAEQLVERRQAEADRQADSPWSPPVARPRSGSTGNGRSPGASRSRSTGPAARRPAGSPAPVKLPPGLRGGGGARPASPRPPGSPTSRDAGDGIAPGQGLRSGRRPAGQGVRVRGGKTPRPKPVGDRPAPRVPAPPSPPPLEPSELTRVPTVTGTPLAPPSEGDGAEPRRAGTFTRMRSVGVPVTGHVTIRGKERKVSGAKVRRTAIGQRYGVVYDTDGPKVTLGVLWFVGLLAGLFVGWWVVTFMFAIAAGWAALEASLRWRERGVAADPLVAGLGAAVVAGAGAAGARFVGGAILLVVAAAVAHVAISPIGRQHTLSAAGNTIGCAIPFGLAAASVILTNDLEIGAAVVLILFVSAYEAGDFLIGSGASNSIEGPVSGVVAIGVVSGAVAVLGVTPFDGAAVYPFAAFAAIACLLGQLAASAILPAADAHSPSARRLDSYLLLAPAWVWAVGVFMQS